MPKSKINLRNVTLCAVDCLNPILASRALEHSKKHCLFGETILLTDRHIDTNSRLVPISTISTREDHSAFILRELVKYVSTPWVLIVQWDGFVLDGAAWTEDFFDYDYIGASWPHHRDGMTVGNGGFSLRSTRLLRVLATDPRFEPDPAFGEDHLICRTFRPVLEAEYGIRFAPDSIADRFSFERSVPTGPTFGFHGIFNMHRLADAGEMQFIAKNAHPRTVSSRDFIGFWIRCLESGQVAAAHEIYARLRATAIPQAIEAVLASNGLTQSKAAERVAFCESMFARDSIPS
jgi:hypothetical protein